jgi:hypothetical protein
MSVQYKEWHGVQVVVVVVHSGVLIKGVKRLDFLCWKREKSVPYSIQTTRRRSKSERSRAKTTGFFPTRKRNREDAGIVGVVLF